jgi:hypothetical protein
MDDQNVLLEARLKSLEDALRRIVELGDAPDETSADAALMEAAAIAEKALAL